MAEFDYGDVIRATGTWEDSAGDAVDPTAVLCSFDDPAGTRTNYVYGVDAELVKSTTGIYYVDIDGDQVGRWHVRLYSTGTGKASNEDEFDISESRFA